MPAQKELECEVHCFHHGEVNVLKVVGGKQPQADHVPELLSALRENHRAEVL